MSFLENKLGIFFLVFAVLCFSIMNGVTRYLSEHYNVITLNMFRYWFFALFLIFMNSKNNQTIIIVSKSKKKIIQIFRGSMLAIQMCFAHYCFLKIGLIETHAIFASCPLIVAVLALFILKEKFGWRRWLAIVFGFVGILIILRPGFKVFDPIALIAVACSVAFALYQVLTRYVSSDDETNTSFFYTGVAGFIILSFIGPFFITEILIIDAFYIFLVCCLGTGGHFLMINAFKKAEASLLQPFVYFHLVFVSIIGVFIFNEKIEFSVVIGSAMIIISGLYTFWREKVKSDV